MRDGLVVAGCDDEVSMAKHVSTVRTPINCQFSRLGFRLVGFEESDQPETLWVCGRRAGTRRALTGADCALCEFWQPMDEAKTRRADASIGLRWRLQCE